MTTTVGRKRQADIWAHIQYNKTEGKKQNALLYQKGSNVDIRYLVRIPQSSSGTLSSPQKIEGRLMSVKRKSYIRPISKALVLHYVACVLLPKLIQAKRLANCYGRS